MKSLCGGNHITVGHNRPCGLIPLRRKITNIWINFFSEPKILNNRLFLFVLIFSSQVYQSSVMFVTCFNYVCSTLSSDILDFISFHIYNLREFQISILGHSLQVLRSIIKYTSILSIKMHVICEVCGTHLGFMYV